MLTEAFRACSLGPSRPSVRPGSPGRGFSRARARKVVFARFAHVARSRACARKLRATPDSAAYIQFGMRTEEGEALRRGSPR